MWKTNRQPPVAPLTNPKLSPGALEQWVSANDHLATAVILEEPRALSQLCEAIAPGDLPPFQPMLTGTGFGTYTFKRD